jgi:hypothetical protein
MTTAYSPALYQINTRVWLTGLSRVLGRPATLDDVPDAELDRLAEAGFDWIWLLSVWCTGTAGRKISRTRREWRREFEETLPDLREEDIAGSGFSIADYTVHPELGGDSALGRLRARLRKRGLHLMLDFVPNHMGPDHRWVENHADYFVSGTENDLKNEPQNYTRVKRKQGDLILAYGRDPYFAGWPDTVQLDYSNPAAQEAMMRELETIAGHCDGVRCDMAMLLLPEVFERTWGRASAPFWTAAIPRVREKHPGFCFMAEVYWDLEWALQQQGFDYTYDKRLYDCLRAGDVRSVRGHLCAGVDYQNSRKPRRAARRCTLQSAGPPCGSRDRLHCSGIAFLSSGAVRWAAEADLAASGPCAAGAGQCRTAEILQRPALCAPAAAGSQRRVALARVRAGLGGELDG